MMGEFRNRRRGTARCTIGVLCFVVGILFAAGGPLSAADRATAPEVRFGTSGLGEGDSIVFASPFAAPPVVVVSGQWQGSPWLAAPDAVTRSSFTLRFRNPAGGAAVVNPTGTWVQYLAVVPDPGSKVLAAGTIAAKDGDVVRFGRTLSGVPAVVCSAVDPSGVTLYSSPASVDDGSFTIRLTDLAGKPAAGTLHYIAVVPTPTPQAYRGAKIAAGSLTVTAPGAYRYGTALPTAPAVILCSSSLASGAATVATANQRDSVMFLGSEYDLSGANGSLSGPCQLSWVAAME